MWEIQEDCWLVNVDKFIDTYLSRTTTVERVGLRITTISAVTNTESRNPLDIDVDSPCELRGRSRRQRSSRCDEKMANITKRIEFWSSY